MNMGLDLGMVSHGVLMVNYGSIVLLMDEFGKGSYLDLLLLMDLLIVVVPKLLEEGN